MTTCFYLLPSSGTLGFLVFHWKCVLGVEDSPDPAALILCHMAGAQTGGTGEPGDAYTVVGGWTAWPHVAKGTSANPLES